MDHPFNGSPFFGFRQQTRPRGPMSFSEEQIAFRDNVRKMATRHVAPIAAEIDETDRFPTELVKLFGDMGLMQLWVPEQYGGPNGNLTMACIAREEISKISPACASIAALNTMFIMPLLHFGSEEQRKKYLPIIAKGGVVTAKIGRASCREEVWVEMVE